MQLSIFGYLATCKDSVTQNYCLGEIVGYSTTQQLLLAEITFGLPIKSLLNDSANLHLSLGEITFWPACKVIVLGLCQPSPFVGRNYILACL